MNPPRKVGDRVLHDGKLHEITSVTPILTKGRADGKVTEVKVEGYCLGLRKVRWYEREDD